MSTYTKFVRGLIASPSMEVSVMCGVARQDIRTVTGGNLVLLRRKTGLDMSLCGQGEGGAPERVDHSVRGRSLEDEVPGQAVIY